MRENNSAVMFGCSVLMGAVFGGVLIGSALTLLVLHLFGGM